MTLDEFKEAIKSRDPLTVIKDLISKAEICALPKSATYDNYRARVHELFPETEFAYVVGSGCWGYSLNPDKLWSPFRGDSDIDIAVISKILYEETWAALRQVHREHWYRLSRFQREQLRRNGENVYAGFASPSWIPVRGHPLAYEFRSKLNRLSSKEVGYKPAKLMFFRNETEMLDYYSRGFRNAKRTLNP